MGNDVFQAAGVAQKYNCSLVRLDYQQEQGLVSSLPLGINQIKIQRSLTTSNVAVFVPFVTQELFQSGAAMYYGINAKSHNMIMLDRKQARCPNGLKLGTPGSGKSMSCKSEIVSVFLTTADDIFISDPEAEYYPLVKRLHGQVIKLSPTSKDYVNPLDINLNYSEDDSPLALKSDFVLSFCELVMGGKTGLEAIERTVIDRAVKAIYRPYLANPCPENMPILSDLHQALLDQHLPEADRVAQALDLYVSGSLNVFNHKTNVDIHNRLVSFDIKELGKQLKKLGMLIIQDQIWGRVTQNRSQGRATWYFADEFHLLLKEEQTAAYSAEIWKRFRKWGGVPTGATQNVKDLLSSPEIENILENSDFITLLNQASGDRKILSERLNLSADQQKYIDNSEPGEGLLIFENVVLPFSNPMAGCTKPVKRLWISSMEDAAIREGFANLRPDSDYDALYQSALCRAKADWLVGINATRLFSVLYHKSNYAKATEQISVYEADMTYSELFEGQKVKFWPIDEKVPDSKVSVISISDLNRALAMQNKAPITLNDGQYLLNCNYNGTYRYIAAALQSHPEITVGGVTLQRAEDKVLQETYIMTSVGNNDRGTLIVPDSVTASLEKDVNALLVQYEPNADSNEILQKMIPIGLDSTHGYRYAEKNMMYETFYGLDALVSFLCCYIGLVFLLICAALLALKQLTETTDNVYRYGLLQKLGAGRRQIDHTLFVQTVVFFAIPLVVAGVYSAFLIGKAMAVVEEFMNIHIATNIGLTIVLFLLVYGSYFLATYLSCKRIVTEQRELEV